MQMQVTAAGKDLVLVQECNQRPQVCAPSDSVRISFEQPIRLRICAVKLVRLAGFILRLETCCLSASVFAVRPLGTPAARYAQLQANATILRIVWVCLAVLQFYRSALLHLGTPEAYPHLLVAAARSASEYTQPGCQILCICCNYAHRIVYTCFLSRIHFYRVSIN